MGVQPDWLAAREPADAAAREITASTLLPALIEHLDRCGPAEVVEFIDLGAGTGANQRWLRPRFPRPQRWIHLDHDPAILRHAYGTEATTAVVGGLDRLPDLIGHAAHPVLTCSALLDVLSGDQLDRLCSVVITTGTPALFSLSVTGEWHLTPADPLDPVIARAFDDHQRRGGRVGPDAPARVVRRMQTGGLPVRSVPTPWVLTPADDPAFVRRFLTERVAAATEQDPPLASTAARWLARRLAHLPDRVVVGHRDLLILPPPRG